MRINKKLCLAGLALLLSACADNPPAKSIGWAYAVGYPILYERPLYPYASSGDATGSPGAAAPGYNASGLAATAR